MKFISQVGVELEGGWAAPPENEAAIIHNDISVKNGTDGFPRFITAKGAACPHWGEIASPPMSTKAAEVFIKDTYPASVNSSCGFHIHISFRRTLDYARVMNRAFWTAFLEAAEKWGVKQKFPPDHEFWGRLEGQNRFARRTFRPMAQIAVTNKDGPGAGANGRDTRRTILNYCWTMHKTLECRLFPAWKTPEEAIEALRFFVEFVEGYLGERAKKREKMRRAYMTYTPARLDKILARLEGGRA